MPKVKLSMGVGDYISRLIKRAGYTQTAMAKVLRITQQALSRKIKFNQFTYDELKEIFSAVNATDAEIIKVMRGFI